MFRTALIISLVGVIAILYIFKQRIAITQTREIFSKEYEKDLLLEEVTQKTCKLQTFYSFTNLYEIANGSSSSLAQ